MQQNLFNTPTEPKPSRPHIPEYGIPESEEGMLAWSYVCERMAQARNYWISTTSPEGQPHGTPVWGVGLDPSRAQELLLMVEAQRLDREAAHS